jgi:hypothetical protein
VRSGLSKLSAEAAYGQLRSLISTAPNLHQTRTEPETRQWMGRAAALISEVMGIAANARFSRNRDRLGDEIFGAEASGDILGLLYEALAIVEMELPAKAQGAFIPAGNVFDAISAVSKILDSASSDLLIVDPYLDAKILTDFAAPAPEQVPIRLLADAAHVKGSLAPAAKAWVSQHGATRPLTVRLTPKLKLHDRLIFIDQKEVWTVGQSFNRLAARAPTSFGKVDPDTAAMKIAAYSDIWDSSQEL